VTTDVPVTLGRRALLLAGASALACSRSERASGAGLPFPSSPNVSVLEWDLGPQPWGPGRAVVVVPAWAPADARFPVVVALHGRGEALKSPAEGAMGWPRDYALVRAFDRLHAPPLRDSDYEGLVEPARLIETNDALKKRPFGGVIVACPWLPDVRPAGTGDVAPYTRFLLSSLLPRVRRDTPALVAPESTGIDGVSLGGVLALRIGLACPDTFGAVGAIQPALGDEPTSEWSVTALAARARRPGLRLRLVTSQLDYFRDPVFALSRAWNASGVTHDFADLPGPHDYVFNRGPGSIELLLWHDRVLAR
jgi:hypothetical protein